ncbi:MAG: toll/interleukin-1 receptor domain-containing protein [Hyphomonadaceae bacterium]
MDIYFIYAAEDAPRAREIAEALGRAGHRARTDRTLQPGQSYEEAVADRLAKADRALILWSVKSLAAPGLAAEAEAAQRAGKLLSARLEPVSPPPAFAAETIWDLSAAAGLEDLIAALAQARDSSGGQAGIRAAADLSRAVPPGRPRFMRRPKFWLITLAIALAVSGIIFLSPEGQMGRGVGIAGREGSLAMSFALAFAFLAFARAAHHLSGRWVGKESPAYFSKEFLAFSAAAALLALWLGASGAAPQDVAGAQASFLYGFGSALIFIPALLALGVAMFRAMRRLLFGVR